MGQPRVAGADPLVRHHGGLAHHGHPAADTSTFTSAASSDAVVSEGVSLSLAQALGPERMTTVCIIRLAVG
jgi:hypothetical protein